MTVYNKPQQQDMSLRGLDEKVKRLILENETLANGEYEMLFLYVMIKLARSLDHISLATKDVLERK